ncbi:ABC transporter permease [Streptomyces nanshensis]|nr:ABC transporter permease [Streptomyces nanshensis]
MTATTAAEPRPPNGEPSAGFRCVLAAEWTKLWSLRSTVWTLVIGALTVIGFNAGTAYEDYRHWPGWDARMRAAFVPKWAMLDAFTDAAALGLMVTAGTIGALVIVGEYGTGSIRTTFAAVPDRRSVMAAKATVVTVVTTALGGTVAAASFGLTQAILGERHAGLSLGDPGALRVVVASALLGPVAALAGLALGALVRHGAITMVTQSVLLFLLPMGLSDDRYVAAVVDHSLPYSAWTRLVQVGSAQPGVHPWTAAGAWTVYALWAAAGAALALIAVHRRDQ